MASNKVDWKFLDAQTFAFKNYNLNIILYLM